ncbi:MAG: hypothetical protein NT051_04945 [Candidatus Micrarchaeota archaeon]|nr:hypothetical protein [Candidatus Micrarchaeota archaeon]
MILYFDNYITNAPLFKYLYDDLSELRKRAKIYAAPNKLDVTLYTLASYAQYPWSGVLIKYELENKSQNRRFEREVKRLFPKAVIIAERSDSQKKYQEAYRMLEKMDDDWVFYAGNNDHPFVCPDFSMLEKCLAKAKELKRKHKYVSIWYSHLLEGAALIPRKEYGKLLPELVEHREKTFEDDDLLVYRNYGSAGLYAIEIANIGFLKHLFYSKDIGDKRVRRTDDFSPEITVKGKITVYPKLPICEHFDGYGNLSTRVGFDVNIVVPPLFIPTGFFEKDIKIAFGYEKYREGWLNINPAKKKYSFESKEGTDMKVGLKNLPFFWKGRISKVDISPKIDRGKLEALGNGNYANICYPWTAKGLEIYHAKYVAAPVWRMRKLVGRTRIYLKDPQFLDETLNTGSFPQRMYKKAILGIVKVSKRKNI